VILTTRAHGVAYRGLMHSMVPIQSMVPIHSMVRWAAMMTAAVLLSGCTGSAGGSADRTSDPASTRLTASGPGGTAGPSGSSESRPAPTSPEEAVHTIALTAADLPADWDVVESPTDGNLDDDPTFLGLCNFEFLSERRRTAKVPVTGIDPQGNPVLSTEAVAYDEYDAAQLALIELRGAYANCPPDQTFTEIPVIDQTGLAEDRVVVEYTLAEGTTQTVIVQRRGSLLSVVLGEARLITFDAARKIYQRMAALTPEAAGDA